MNAEELYINEMQHHFEKARDHISKAEEMLKEEGCVVYEQLLLAEAEIGFAIQYYLSGETE